MNKARQNIFGWIVATDLFLAGTGATAFLFSFILDRLHLYAPIAQMGAILGPILVIAGSILLMAEAGSRTKSYRLFLNPSSWMTRGIWTLTAFIVLSLAYALPSFRLFDWLPWNKDAAFGQTIGAIAALLSTLVLLYPGFLLGVMKRIPSWNTPVLPVLFLMSGLCTGTAAILLTALFQSRVLGIAGFHQIALAGSALTFGQILVLASYLEIVRHSGLSSAESVRSLLKSGLFIWGVIATGLLLPLVLLSYSLAVNDNAVLSSLIVLASLFMLGGGLFLRYSIIRAGVPLPVYST